MSLISRLYRVVRANLGSRDDDLSASPPDGGDASAPDDRDERERSAAEPRDPKLARYYANLEVPYGSDLATVTAAWKRLMKQYHPDRHSGDPEKEATANQLVQELNTAHDYLRRHLERRDA